MQFREKNFCNFIGPNNFNSLFLGQNAIIILIYQMKFFYIEQLTKRYLCTILCLKTNVLILKHLRSAPAVYPWNNQQHQQQYPSYNSYSNGLPEQVKHFFAFYTIYLYAAVIFSSILKKFYNVLYWTHSMMKPCIFIYYKSYMPMTYKQISDIFSAFFAHEQTVGQKIKKVQAKKTREIK